MANDSKLARHDEYMQRISAMSNAASICPRRGECMPVWAKGSTIQSLIKIY
jgi:hypothetical protein